MDTESVGSVALKVGGTTVEMVGSLMLIEGTSLVGSSREIVPEGTSLVGSSRVMVPEGTSLVGSSRLIVPEGTGSSSVILPGTSGVPGVGSPGAIGSTVAALVAANKAAMDKMVENFILVNNKAIGIIL